MSAWLRASRSTPAGTEASGWKCAVSCFGSGIASRPVEQGADTVVWLATLDARGPTGGFFHDRHPIDWW